MSHKPDGRIIVGILAALALVTLLSKRRNEIWHGRGSEPEIMSFDETDMEMNAAMERARGSVDTFINALESGMPSHSHLAVKVGFHDENGDEFMWLNDVRYQEGVFYGNVGNEPGTVGNVRYGDPVKVSKEKIADWMYIANGKLAGGYTMRVMRDRLSPEERADFDANIGFTID